MKGRNCKHVKKKAPHKKKKLDTYSHSFVYPSQSVSISHITCNLSYVKQEHRRSTKRTLLQQLEEGIRNSFTSRITFLRTYSIITCLAPDYGVVIHLTGVRSLTQSESSQLPPLQHKAYMHASTETDIQKERKIVPITATNVRAYRCRGYHLLALEAASYLHLNG